MKMIIFPMKMVPFSGTFLQGEKPKPIDPLGIGREVSSPIYQPVKVEGPSFPTFRASQLKALRIEMSQDFSHSLLTVYRQRILFLPFISQCYWIGISQIILREDQK